MSSGFLTRSEANETVQPQRLHIGLKKMNFNTCVAKTKMLISCAVTAQLVSFFTFAYAKKMGFS